MVFIPYHTIDSVQQVIKEKPLVFLYTVTTGCSVCHGLQPQVEALLDQYPEVTGIVVNSEEVPEIASVFELLTAPGLLLFVEGKEYLRRAKMIQTQAFTQSLEKIVTSYLQSKDQSY